MSSLLSRIKRFLFGEPEVERIPWDKEDDPFVQRLQNETRASKEQTKKSKDWLSIPLSERFVSYPAESKEREAGR